MQFILHCVLTHTTTLLRKHPRAVSSPSSDSDSSYSTAAVPGLFLLDAVLTHSVLAGHHHDCVHRGRESHGPEFLQRAVQPDAPDVPEPVPDHLLPDGGRWWLPHIQPVSVPLLLRGPTGGLKLFLLSFGSLFDKSFTQRVGTEKIWFPSGIFVHILQSSRV